MGVNKLGAVPTGGSLPVTRSPAQAPGDTSQAPEVTSQRPGAGTSPTALPRAGTPGDSLALSRIGQAPYPLYPTMFGPQAFVRDGRDATLLKAVADVAARAPELLDPTTLAQLRAGHLQPDGIQHLQRFLEAKGYSVGGTGVDGKYGPLTHQALSKFLDGSATDHPPRPLALPAASATPAAPSTPAHPVTAPAPASTSAPSAPTKADAPPKALPSKPVIPTAPIPAGMPAIAPSAERLPLPPRSPHASTGSQFLEQTRGMSASQREQAILDAVLSGNVPDFLRQFKTLEVSFTDGQGIVHHGRVRVLPDYLAIGSDQDHVRIPMSPLTAQRIADRLGCSLPTRKLVDETYRQAEVRVAPRPLPAGPQMTSNAYTLRHQQEIQKQLLGPLPGQTTGGQPVSGQLVAGHKKDVVISSRLEQQPGRVAIYGWHMPDGKPIQSLSTVHEASYADYSHGIRLVAGTMTVDGVERPVRDILRDPLLSHLLSDEGILRNPRYPTP